MAPLPQLSRYLLSGGYFLCVSTPVHDRDMAGYTSVDPVMSKAGVMTHPDCAKYSTEEAVATCESGLRQRGGSSRFSFGIGVTRILD